MRKFNGKDELFIKYFRHLTHDLNRTLIRDFRIDLNDDAIKLFGKFDTNVRLFLPREVS